MGSYACDVLIILLLKNGFDLGQFMAANTFTSRRHNESISTVTTENCTCSCTYVHAFIYLFVISFQGPIYKRAGPWSINLLIYFYSLSLLLSILQLKDKYFEVKTNPSRWRHVVNGVSKYVFGGGGSSMWIKYTQFHFLSRMYFLLPNILLTYNNVFSKQFAFSDSASSESHSSLVGLLS